MRYNCIILLIILTIPSCFNFLDIKSNDYPLAEPLIDHKIYKPDKWIVPYGFIRTDTFF